LPTANEILAYARSYIGITENPANSNNVQFNTRYYGHEVSGSAYPWCCAFQWCLFQDIGAPELFYGGNKTASCTTLYNYYKKCGQTVNKYNVQPGDLVFFVFDGNTNGTMNHIGVCESAYGGYVTTIDGNTGTTNEANGGAVMRRKRALKYVGGVARPAYYEKQEEDIVTQDQFNEMMGTYVEQLKSCEPGSWSAAERDWAEGNGLIVGNNKGQKAYQSFITVEQFIVVLHRFFSMIYKVFKPRSE